MSDIEIFTKIWTSPRLVFKYVNDNHYDKYVVLLLVLAGILRSFDRASTQGVGDKISLPGIIALCIIVGGLFGWIIFYLYSALLS